MKSWQLLQKKSLLGTERAALVLEELPHAVQQKLTTLPTADRETQFLRAATLVWNYERAGAMPQPVAKLELKESPLETQKIAPPQYSTTFLTISEDRNFHISLMDILFKKMIQQQFVFPSALVVDVLRLLENVTIASNLIFRKNILHVVGERGKWLLQFNKKWKKFFAEEEENEIWKDGTNAQRNEIFRQWAISEPQKAIQRFEEDWEKENPKTRRDWLNFFLEKNINNSIIAENIAFFENAYNEFLGKGDSKNDLVTQQMGALRVALLAVPTSQLFEKTVLELKKYVKNEKKMLGLMQQKKLELPMTDDHFFNGTTMQKEYGTANASVLPQWSSIFYWFNTLLNDLHPSAWEQIFETSWEQIFKIFDISFENNLEQLTFVQVSVANVLAKFQYEKGIRAFIAQNDISHGDGTLLNILTEKELEEYALKVNFSELNSVKTAVLRDGFMWSKRLSRHILQGVTDIKSEPYQQTEFVQKACQHFHLSIIHELYDLSMLPQNNWREEQRHKQIIMPLLKLLEMRQQIENL